MKYILLILILSSCTSATKLRSELNTKDAIIDALQTKCEGYRQQLEECREDGVVLTNEVSRLQKVIHDLKK